MFDHYSVTRSQTGDTMDIMSQLKESLGRFGWSVRYRWEKIRAREPMGPQYRQLLDDVLALAQASDEIVRSTESSVLGPRMLLQQTESKRFANKSFQDAEEIDDDPLYAPTVKEDLKD